MDEIRRYCRENVPLYFVGNIEGTIYFGVTDFLVEMLDRSGFELKPFGHGTPAPTIEKTSCGGKYVLKDENGETVFAFGTVEEFENKIKKHFYVFLK